MGLLDRAFLDAGFSVQAGCEIDPRMRRMHDQVCGGDYLTEDLTDLVSYFNLSMMGYDGVIGGPPCQSHSKTRAMRKPKFPDLTPLVNACLAVAMPEWYLFENVCPLDIPGSKTIRLDAMHFYKPHQSRPRWFTYSPNLTPPSPVYAGTVNDLMAYPAVAAKIFGPYRGAALQGYPAANDIDASCVDKQLGLANAVPYPLALAWANSIKETFS